MSKKKLSDIYCQKVLTKKISIKIVFESEDVLAYYHTNPNWPVHIVVIPKKHIDSLETLDINDPSTSELIKIVQEVAKKIKREHGACRVITNLGEYQDSKHLHFHVVYGTPI